LLQVESFRRGKWFSANKNPLIVLPLKSEQDRKPSFKKQKQRETALTNSMMYMYCMMELDHDE